MVSQTTRTHNVVAPGSQVYSSFCSLLTATRIEDTIGIAPHWHNQLVTYVLDIALRSGRHLGGLSFDLASTPKYFND